jgi:hypothetical protein
LLVPALALGLGGCFSTTGGGGSADPPSTLITQVQQSAVAICGFLPNARDVGDIFLAGNANYTVAADIAEAICRAIKTRSFRAGKPVPPQVAGVVVRGTYVR